MILFREGLGLLLLDHALLFRARVRSLAGSLATSLPYPCNKREMARSRLSNWQRQSPSASSNHFICPSSQFPQEQPRGQLTSTTTSNAEPGTLWSSSATYIGLRWASSSYNVLLPASRHHGGKAQTLSLSLPQIHPWRPRAAHIGRKVADSTSRINRQPVLQNPWASGVNSVEKELYPNKYKRGRPDTTASRCGSRRRLSSVSRG